MGAESGPDAQRLALWKTYLRGQVAILRALERELQASHQLSLAEYDVLLSLNNAAGHRLRLGELAEAVLFSSGGLSRLLDRLERAGLVARERTPDDRRGVYATVTDAGHARLRAASVTHLRGIQRHFAAALPADEIEPVRRFLDRLLAQTPATPAEACELAPPTTGC
jgi:DNA-binding MarR family transcriptional regulator